MVVSTASPFKFAADVLEALGESAQGDPLKALSDKSGMAIPAPLDGLKDREVRFEGCARRDGMRDAVDEFLK